ncbi:DNA topoisomerase, partial [Vibrio anguillarum]
MMTFDGWKAIYKDNDDDDEDDSLDNLAEQTIPQLIQNESVPVRQVDIEKKHTKPPSRYTEATLIKALENRGIGRPSTYASIMKTLYVRLYMDNDKRFIYPTDRGIKLVDSLKDTFQFLQYEYTANMENEIDRIAQGQSTYDHIIPKANSDLEYEIKSFIKARTQHQPLIDCPIC